MVNVRDLRQMEKEFSALSFQVTVCCLFNLLYVSASVYCYVFNGTHQCYINRFSIAWNTLCLPPDFGLAIFFFGIAIFVCGSWVITRHQYGISAVVPWASLGWLSNRTGTSLDDGARKSNNWLDQMQSGKSGTGSGVQSFPVVRIPVLLLNQPIPQGDQF